MQPLSKTETAAYFNKFIVDLEHQSNLPGIPLRKQHSEKTSLTVREKISYFLRNAGLRILDLWVYGDGREPKKAVTTQNRSVALLRSWVHILPVAVTITLAVLNLQGFFIGSTLQGFVDPIAQTFDLLMLQICAKLMELLVVASLAVMIMDILRNMLLSRGLSLPLGLLIAQGSFQDASYFWSPEFLCGCKGLKSWRLAIGVGLALSVAGFISLLVGPATALLVIPTIRDSWPAGSTEFWINGTTADLWPALLNQSHTGGDECLIPSFAALNAGQLNYSGCAWAGWSQLGEFFRSNHLNDDNENITINDGLATRSLVYWSSSPELWQETWALGTNAAIGLASDNIEGSWYQALFKADADRLSPSKLHYKYRIQSSSFSSVAGRLPAVRTACRTYANDTLLNDTATPFIYPFLPEFNIDDRNIGYVLNTSFPETSTVATAWLKPPAGRALQLSNGSISMYTPSAFLSIWLPAPGNSSRGSAWTCTVDARWAPGLNIGNHLGDQTHIGSDFITVGSLTDTRAPNVSDPNGKGFLPNDNGQWTTADLSMDWLNTLTPSLSYYSNATQAFVPSNDSGWTTLASILQGAGIDNSTAAIADWGDIRSPVESMIASVVADGMSRVGYSPNGGSLDSIAAQSNQAGLNMAPSSIFPTFLNGRASIPPSWTNDTSGLTKLEWTATIAGYAYKADSLAYYLSLALLFGHATLAIAHTLYRVITARSSDAWASAAELLVLAQQSAPAEHALGSTCAGIQRGTTFQQGLRIRAVTRDARNDTGAGEELQMLVGEDQWTDKANGLQDVNIGQKYGSRAKAGLHPNTF